MDSLNPHLLIKKMNLAFDSLKCAAKLKVAFGFVLDSEEDGSCLNLNLVGTKVN